MQAPKSPTFRSAEFETFWRYVSSSLDRLVGVSESLTPEALNWRPPAPETNSIAVLVHHTVSNARVNLLGTLCGQEVNRDRESEFTVVAAGENILNDSWTTVRRDFEDALSDLTDDSLDATFAHHWRGDITGREILIIVARQAAEHLGQAELTRDLALAALQQDSESRPADERLETST